MSLACPKCGSTKWYKGPRGGVAQDVLCANCGTEFCDAGAFGLDELPREESRAALYGLDALPSSSSSLGQGKKP